MKNILIMVFMFTATSQLIASPWEELTDHLAENLARQVSGMHASQGPVTIHTSCRTRVLGRCVLEEKIRAQGSATIRDQIYQSGRILRSEVRDPLRNNSLGYYYTSTFYMEFDYTSQVSARKYHGGIEVDTVWGSLHPEGIIKVWFIASEETDFRLKFAFEAAPGHSDRANNFVVDYIVSDFKTMIRDRAKDILGIRHIEIIN